MPGLGGSPGEENSYLRQYSCVENPTDRGAWQAAVHGVANSWTGLNDKHFHFQTRSHISLLIFIAKEL